MKKNMVPLLGIAFVVAIVCTGVFYGLFAGRLRSKPVELEGQAIVVAARALERGTVLTPADLRVSQVKGSLAGSFSKTGDAVGATLLEPLEQNEPLLRSRVASRDAKGPGAGGGIAAGMRAVSIRVAESNGLMSLVHEGSRVDVQAVSDRNGPAELRTILQNMEVLRVSAQLEPSGNNRPAVSVVTVLVPAQYADVIALADTGARIRLALRNPLDDGTLPRHALGLASIFSGGRDIAAQSASTVPAAERPADGAIQLRVQILGASAIALGELDSKLAGSADGDPLRVAAFREGADADELVRRLEQSRELEIVSSSNLVASAGRPASVRAAAAPYRLRVQFSASADATGKRTLLVQPEISLRRGAGVETRRFDSALPEGASFLVKGLLNDSAGAGTLARLFPGHVWAGRKLVIFVTARPGQAARAAIAQANRGR